MKKYKYETVVSDGVMAFKLSKHRQIIDACAKEGWRYVGHIPTYESAHGVTQAIDLIFEKDVKESE